MSKRKKKKISKEKSQVLSNVHPDVKKNISIIIFLGLAIIFILAAADQAGPLGDKFYQAFKNFFGLGYFLLPITSFILAFLFVLPNNRKSWKLTFIGVLFFVISSLGFLDIISPESGGLTGTIIGALEKPLGTPASLIITFAIIVASLLVIINRPFRISEVIKPIKFKKSEQEKIKFGISSPTDDENENSREKFKGEKEPAEEKEEDVEEPVSIEAMANKESSKEEFTTFGRGSHDNYKAPPLSLFVSRTDKPTPGDLRANANIIRRTLDSFGIPVEMGEVQIGPTVTRYTLKPAEGIKLSRIIALGSDLSLALAAHPIRIEAPIPGKSLVGIEIPNKNAAVVRLGNLLSYEQFQKSSPLSFILGRGVNGDPIFSDLAKMPHLLIAGSTGSGKSIFIHSLILSLLSKNSPEHLQMIMIDPKRVELSVYNGIPHLISPVITDNKKSIGVLKWAITEMERRYEILLDNKARDIKSFNQRNGDRMPYILIVIDELADLMVSYGREVEGAIIRLAQMSRAVGIHLVVSTQRPSVEVITGLIKANITSRVALQVASGVDSRTILDTGGAEKLLGNGDLLFISAEYSKPRRIQGPFVSEKEIGKVARYIEKNNKHEENEIDFRKNKEEPDSKSINFDEFNGEEDELYEDAVGVIRKDGRASASLLQRRLRIGYARAARLLDIMEERELIGPARGAKPREVYLDKEDDEYINDDE